MAWVRAIAAEAKARGATVMLTAEMGNLSLHAGGLPALAEWLRQRRWASWWAQARSAARSGEANWKGILYNSFGHQLPSGLRKALGQTFLHMPIGTEFNFGRSDTPAPEQEPPALNRYSGRYAQRFDLIARYDIGSFRKGALAEFGIEERDPTADRRLIDFSFRLPPAQLLDDGIWRPLARRALAEILPLEVVNSRLRGYQAADWYERLTQADARALLEQISATAAVGEILDTDKIRSAIDAWPTHGWADARTIANYRVRLPIALLTGVFIQEFAGSAMGSAPS
jgi:asparagine synthase (glutamine-hydrolysing)